LAQSPIKGVVRQVSPADPEVVEKAKRRQFSAQYKLRVLRAADTCEAGELRALLRREGLYSSNLTTWRRQRERGELEALSPKQRGPKAKPANPAGIRLAELERENRRLVERLKQTEAIIEVQKKVAALLGNPLLNESSENS
jgi:transposase-like protein